MSAHDDEIMTIISLCGRKDQFLGDDDPTRHPPDGGPSILPLHSNDVFFSISLSLFVFLFGLRYNISRVVGYQTELGDVAWGFTTFQGPRYLA